MGSLSLIAIVISIIALIRSKNVSVTISELERKLRNIENRLEHETTPITQLVSSQSVPAEANYEVETIDSGDTEQSQVAETEYTNGGYQFIKWLKEDWLLKLGGVLVLMGVLFFLSLAFTSVGPQGKVAIGYVFGIVLMVFGFKYINKNLIGGSAVHLIGAITVIITTYVARLPGYDLFDPYFAMLLMFFTSVCVALTAYAYKRAPLAYVGLLMSGIVPILVTTGQPNFFGLLMYLLVVVVGVLWLSIVTRWRGLVLLSLFILCSYSGMFFAGELGPTLVSFKETYALIIFGVLFYVTSVFSILRTKGETGYMDGYVALLNAAYALMWILNQVSHEMAPIIIALVGLVYAIGFFVVYKITNVYTSFIVYGGVTIGMLTTAIMLQLEGRAESVALLLIGLGVTIYTYQLSNNASITRIVSLFNILPFGAVFISISNISRAIRMNEGLSGDAWKDICIVVIAILISGYYYRYFKGKVSELSIIGLLAEVLFLVVGVWQILHLVIGGGFATFASLVIYTVFGLLVLLQGSQQKNELKVRIARYWLGLVAAHIIFIDAWQVGDITTGVFICVVIGVLLLSSSFIIKKVSQE